jgi:predicted permease
MQLLKHLKAFFHRRKLDSDLSDELRFHLEKEVEQNIARGMSADEARRQALITFGGVLQTREKVRDARGMRILENAWQDSRYALRIFRKSPGFTAVAVFTLALGIGMNTAIFSLIDAVLFRALPANDPEQLVLLRWHAHQKPRMLHSHRSYGDCPNHRQGEHQDGCSLSLPFVNMVRSQSSVFSGVAAFATAPQLDLSGNGAATIVNRGQLVSGDTFTTLGVHAALGRMLQPVDDTPSAPPAVVLSYGFWQSAFGAAPDAVGRTVRLNGLPYTIVGVAEQKFSGLSPGRKYDLWLPFAARSRLDAGWVPEEDDAGSWWIIAVGRLKPGISTQQAQEALSLLYADETIHGQKPLFQAADAPGIDVVAAQEGLEGSRHDTLPPLYLLMMAVALVLLIACANISGLLLSRAASRGKEIAIRLTLGARRGRLVFQLMIESLILSALGASAGLLLASWGARGLLLLATKADGGPLPFTPQLDGRVLAFTAATAILTGVIFGLVPALKSLRVDLTPTLKSGGGSSEFAPRARWYGMGNVLVVAQVSLAIVALVTAGLLVRTLSNLKSAELGFDARNMLVFGLNPTLAGYKGRQIDALNRGLQEQIAALPGVTSVSYSWISLLNGGEWDTGFHAPGTPEKEESDAAYMTVGPRFFETMHIPLKVGRDFNAADFAAAAARASLPPGSKPDSKAAPTTVVVNETFVRRFFPHVNPIGQHVEASLPEDPSRPRSPGWEIIGVCGDARYESLRDDINPTMYAASGADAYFSVRTAGDPLAMVPAIRTLINQRDSNLAMFRIASETQQIDQLVFVEGLVARLSSFFGSLALLLACTGIYGLLSYEVTRRTREIGIRMAVGARRGDVVRMVVRQGLMVALAGAVIGVAASFAVKRLVSNILYHVKLGDPVTLAAIAVILFLVALAACYLPARRATRVDPLVALRYE